LLDDAQIERYARQIVVPGIGAAGQEKLLNSTVLVVGHPRGCATAALYLRAAGVTVVSSADTRQVDVVLVADTAVLDEVQCSALLSLARPVCWYSSNEDGFTSGVHPYSPLPPVRSTRGFAVDMAQDAAACVAASDACAIVCGLLVRREELRFDTT